MTHFAHGSAVHINDLRDALAGIDADIAIEQGKVNAVVVEDAEAQFMAEVRAIMSTTSAADMMDSSAGDLDYRLSVLAAVCRRSQCCR